jgi:hypothetical protein
MNCAAGASEARGLSLLLFYRRKYNRKPRYYGRALRERGASAASLGVSAK